MQKVLESFNLIIMSPTRKMKKGLHRTGISLVRNAISQSEGKVRF